MSLFGDSADCETPCRYSFTELWYGYDDAQVILFLSLHICMVEGATAQEEEIRVDSLGSRAEKSLLHAG